MRILSTLPALALVALAGAAPTVAISGASHFGAEVTADSARPLSEILATAEAHAGKIVKIAGRTDGVCTKKGCWLTLENPEHESLRVTFRDYGFFVPEEILGQDVVVEGTLEIKELSVAELRHLAEDAGRSAAEVAAIDKPVTSATLVADGVLVVEKASK